MKHKDYFKLITKLMNQYHSIDQMTATLEEKEWAKSRLRQDIERNAFNLGDSMKANIKAALKSRDVWEEIRERFA